MRNPWLDFASYQYSDRNRFKGREEDIAKFNLIMANGTMSVLYADSGIGKTSFINAGIDPIFIDKGYFPIHILFNEDTFNSNIDVEKWLISDIESKFYEVINVNDSGKEIKQQIKDWHYLYSDEYTEINKLFNSLWWRLHAYKIKDINNGITLKPLLVFDQFEEVFIKGKKDFLSSLFSIIEEASSSTLPVPISNALDELEEFEDLEIDRQPDFKILFSLRKDYLSDFDYWCNDKYSITELFQNRMLLNALSRKQAKQVICDQEGIDTLDEVANEIIEKIDDKHHDAVEPFILSVFCSRLYEKAISINKEILKKEDLVQIDIKNIIRSFYEEKILSLIPNEAHRFTFETTLVDEDGFRKRERIASRNLTGIGFEKTYAKPLEDSHLIRIITINDAKCVEIVHDRIAEVISERNRQRESEKQAAREKAEAERKQREIEEKAARDKAEMEAEAAHVKQRNKRRLVVLSSVIAFIVLAIVTYYYSFELPYSEEYGNFTTKNGWPIGLGEQLTSSKEKEKCTVYYKLTRNGRLSSFWGESRPFTKVEILNWEGKPTTNVFIESPMVRIIDKELDDAKAAEFAKLLTQVSYWQYTPDANGNISMKTAFDINNQELYSENYSSTNNIDLSSKHVLWSVFNDKKGNPLQVSDNGTDRIRYTISDGYITGCSFFTVLGTPQKNTFGVYGYSYEVDSLSANIISQCLVDKFGDKIDSTIVHFTAFENGRYTKNDVCIVEYSRQNVIWRFTGYNDTIHISQIGFIDCISKTYGDLKRLSAKYKTQDELLEKKLINNDTLVYSANYFYTSRLDSVQYFNTATQPNSYTEKFSYPRKNVIERTFWSNDEKILLNIGFEGIVCHKILEETFVQPSDSTITTSYFDCSNNLTQEGVYSKSEIIFEKKSANVLYEYYYDPHDEICKSEMFTYNEYGIRESRAVAGIDRTPVRCPNWDWNGFSYFRMSFLKDFTDNVFVTTMGTNEYGDNSYIMKDDSIFTISELPLMFTTTEDVNPKIKSKTFSFSLCKNNYKPLTDKKSIPFLHILNKKSILYNAQGQGKDFWRDGLFDNDIPYKVGKWKLGNSNQILLQELNTLEEFGGDIQVLRYNNNGYRILSFSVSSGSLYAETHNIFLTDKEYNKIKKYLK